MNGIVGWLLARLLGPFASWPPIVGLTLVSLIAAAGLLAAFKWTSNQRAIAATKRQVLAGLFELRLFQDDPRLMLRAAGGLLAQQARYLRYAFVPVLWVSVPIAILLAHLQAYYGHDALRPGDTTIVIVHTREDAQREPNSSASGGGDASAKPALTLTLDAPSGLRVETPRVWVPSRREAAWRIAADRAGDYDLRVTWDTTSVTKRVLVTGAGQATIARAEVRPAGRVWDEWLNPSEPPLPSEAPIDAISIVYPPRTFEVLGFSLSWLIIFFVLTTIFMLLGRPFLRVVI